MFPLIPSHFSFALSPARRLLPHLFPSFHLPVFPLYLPFLSFKILSLAHIPQRNNLFPPPMQLCISMPAEHVNLSCAYRHWLVKLSSDSLQRDDHRMPWRIRTAVTISDGGPNILLYSNLAHGVLNASFCKAQECTHNRTITQIQEVRKIKQCVSISLYQGNKPYTYCACRKENHSDVLVRCTTLVYGLIRIKAETFYINSKYRWMRDYGDADLVAYAAKKASGTNPFTILMSIPA